MRRKTFIWTLLAIAAGSVGSIFIYKLRRQKLQSKPLAYPSYLASFMDESDIRKIGISYRLMNRSENNPKTLMELLSKELYEKNRTENNSTSVIEILEKITTKNFENNHITIANGWVLSITEARQCALFSFTQ
jgi:hypothetical protein